MSYVYGEERVNAYTVDYQYAPSVSPLAGGGYVVAWTSREQDGSNDGIYAQRFTASGQPTGPEFRINTTTANNQLEPKLVGLSDGSFAVVWTDRSGADGSSYGVYMQRVSAAGQLLGSEHRVNTFTTNDQAQPSIAAYAGGYVVTWYSNGQDGSVYGVYAQRFDNAGNPVLTGGSNEFRVNSYTSGSQYEPDVAAFADGRFVVVWRSDNQDGSGAGVYAQRYNADGSKAGGEFRVASATSGDQYQARVAALDGGGFVVVWRSDSQDGSSADVYGQRYDANGAVAGGEFRINESTAGGQYQPDVSALAGGGFAVTWYNDNYDASGSGSYRDVYVREYAGDGAPLTGQLKANTPPPTQSNQSEPAIASLGSGNYVVVWRSDGQDGSQSGVYQQLFGDAAELPRQASPSLGDFAGTLTFGENLVNATPQIIDPAVSLLDLDSANLDGGRVEIFYTQFGSAEDQLGVRNQGTGVAQIGVTGNSVSYNDGTGAVAIGTLSGGNNGSMLTVTFNASASVDAVEALIQNLTYANSSNSPQASRTITLRVYDGDGGTSNAGSVQINVLRENDGTPLVHGEERVNTYTPSAQEWPSVATLADGSYVVTWVSSGQDGSSDGVYAQRFASNGEALGPEFSVNTLAGGYQQWPQIAALSDGGFVITWQDDAGNDGSGWGVFGRRFDGAGQPQDARQFHVTTTTASTQYHDNVAAYAGGFAAVWSTGSDIYLQRFLNDGSKLGGETLVSTAPGGGAQAGSQYLPDIAARANGDLVIVWQDSGANDGNGYGVYGRLYNATSGTFGSTFLVNTTTIGNQSYAAHGDYAPNVTVLANGDFVVVWPSDNNDGSGWSVVGQRFDAAGNKLDGEFVVNETTAGSQYQPEVTALSTGGFVVSFYNDNYDLSGAGTTSDVYIREYDASGNPVDGQRKLESPDNGTAYQPAVADLGDGNFAVVYSSYATSANGGNNTHEIRQQLFGDSTALARSASPQLGDFSGTVTFVENAVNIGLQALDTAVGLTDPDSGNFEGGRLDLYYVQGAGAEDQLGVIHESNAPGQIGVAGNTVSYGGSAIGTLSGGANGSNLRIDFTSTAATVEAVEALIQHLGYRNADSSPTTSRTLALRIADGDGGTSAPSTLTVNITQSLDGTPVAHGEERVNTYTAGAQEWPSAATLADGSYVVAWQSNSGQDGDGWGIYAQRFANNGEVIGPEVRVNTLTGGEQSWPQIAALSNGSYVITWQDNGANDDSGWGVFGQRFDANGLAQGSQFLIHTTTSGTQYHDSVAAYSGGFAAAWSTGSDIYLQRFLNDGSKLGGETLVSTVPGPGGGAQGGSQYVPDIAARANGDLVIVWADGGGNDGDTYGVFGRIYTASTGTFGSTFLVNTTTASYQSYGTDGNFAPNVAVLANGDFVVVWPSYLQDGNGWAVVGQRFDAAGNKLDGEFVVNETTAGSQYQPEVTALSTGGFVVSFYNDNYDISGAGTTSDVYIREYDASGNPIDGQRKLASPDNGTAYQPAVTDLGDGNFAVVYSSYATSANGGNNTHEIRQQLFGDSTALARSASPQLGDFSGTVTFVENAVNIGLQALDTAVGLTDPDSGNFEGGRLDLYYVRGAGAEDQLGVIHESNAPGQIGVAGNTVSYGGSAIGTLSGGTNGSNLRIDFTSTAATVEAVEALIQHLGYRNADSSPTTSRTLALRIADGDGGTSAPSTLTVNITQSLDGTPVAHGEEQVNTFTYDYQWSPAVAALSGGAYVTTWISRSQDGAANLDGVFAQRFLDNGEAVGPEFRVNTSTDGNQREVKAAGLADGSFVITWTDQNNADGSGNGVYARRFDTNGAATGSQFLVNGTSTSSTQEQPAIAAFAGGGYIITWQSNASFANGGDGSGYGVYAQRFNTDGTPNGASFRVNTTSTGSQYESDVATHADGSFVVSWRSDGQDGSGVGVYAQRYDAAGKPAVEGEFRVNSSTTGNQYEAKVATLSGGGFVIVWRDDSGADGSGSAVFGQRFNADGSPVAGGQFLVNETTSGGQYQPDVVGLDNGGFVVSFYNDNYDVGGSGSTADVYVREYDAGGVAIDGQRKVNSFPSSTQSEAAIAHLGSDNFVVTWRSDTQDGSNSGIYQQLFGDAAELARPSAAPVLDNFRTQRVLVSDAASSFYAGNPQLIDADVSVEDADSTDFDGGSFTVTLLNGATASEALGIRDQGTGAFQIGVSGSAISFAGTVIGSFTGGGAGNGQLTVTLNANATPLALRALAQNITYQNTAPPSGTTDRYVAFRLTDGDGGTSNAANVEIQIQPTITPTAEFVNDIESSVTLTEAQAQAGGFVLDNAAQVTYYGAGNFNTGTLTVSYLSSSNRVDDQLAIRNQGSGPNEVGISGTAVSFQGTQIGTLSGTLNGVNGNNLQITWNASATDQGIERVIENLTYSTTSDGPNASRSIRFVLTDSTGAASTARDMQINVTPQVDGASPIFGEQQVNTYEAGEQHVPVTVGLQGVNGGGYVVIWRSQNQDGDNYGIYGQRYDAKGAAVGAEFQVNSQTLGAQYEPEVASLANGGFVVAWRDNSGRDGSGAGVFGQIYGADGARVGGERQFNASTTSSQSEPAVVGLSDGSFVVAYRSDYTNSSYANDVLARRFDAAGNELNSEFTLNTTTTGTQYNPRLAALAGGQFVAVYGDASGNDGNGYGVFSKVFNANGTQAVAEQVVSSAVIAGNQSGHDVAALAGGGYVAVWWSADNQLYGQRFDAAGAKLPGGEFRISTVDTVPYNNFARVTALANGGFVVAWDANGYEVYIQQFDAAGGKVDGPTQVNTTTASTQYYADVAAIGSGGNFVVTWAGYNQEAGAPSTYGIFSQILGTPGSITRSGAPELVNVATRVSFDENLVNTTPQLIDAAVRLTDADSASFNGGQLVVAIIPAGQQQPDKPFTQDQLGILSSGSGPGQIGTASNIVSYEGTPIGTLVSSGDNGSNLVVNLNAAATPAAVEALIEHLSYANTSTDPAPTRLVSIQVSDGQGGASTPRSIEIQVTPQVDGAKPIFGEQQVNTYEAGEQHVPVTVGLQGVNGGGYVVIWRSQDQDGDNYGIYGQRYDAKGAAVGAEFQVNSQTLGAQYEPEVASLANGGFVVAWRDNSGRDGSGAGVFGQIYGADGARVGGERQFNASTTSSQSEPAVVGLSDGSFVVAYRSDYTNASNSYAYDVLARRFDAAGSELNSEFTLNTAKTETQFSPRLAALAGGRFVAVYGDTGNDGNGYGVFSKVFNANGTQAVAEQVVSSAVIAGNQSGHDVAALAGGGYVAVWWSADNQLYGQRFDAAGAKLPGGEFRISTVDTVPYNNFARVTALANGGFVVAWDANGYEVYIQQFDAAGGKVDGPTQVNTTTASTQYYADVAAIGSGGNFVVTWAGYNQEAGAPSTYGIFSQILGTPGSITRSGAPELVNVATRVSFDENLVNTTPQLIDAAVRLTDADSASFNGGQLVVSVISGYGSIEQAQLPQAPEAQDQFGIRSQGSGAGQVSVSDTEVRYGGTLIGTISSDGTAGRDLVVTFNGAASVPAVEAVIENLTYRNTASNPVESRLVSIQVSDGAGGAGKPQVVQIDVTPQYDGGQPLFTEDLVNTYTPSDQSQPAMARLENGGYVTVWTSQTQDGWGYGIYGQRYDAQGVAVGNQFQVNDYTPYDQTEPVVASLDGGGFVVVWRDHGGHDGSGSGLFGQRYDAGGLQVGEAFLVNSNTTSNEYQPAIASVAGGGFIVAWYSDALQDGRYYDVYVQRFDNNGSPLGTETRANTSASFTNSAQYEPAVAVLSDASFVVTWRADGGQDGSGAGIYAQRFTADGIAPPGSEFRINTYTANDQVDPSIAALTGGGFVVSWTSHYQDSGGNFGVFAQRYANDGTPVGSEFRVNTSTASNEQQPTVGALANGGFVVVWTNGSQAFAQQFNAAGVAIDGETRVDVTNNSNATQPVVLGLDNGNFVVSWTDRGDDDANSYGINQRLFGNPDDFSRQTNPLLVDVASNVSFGENELNLAPQLIDPGVGLYDPDSANFAGGLLEVDYISGYGGQDQLGMQGLENQDQLGIRSEGDNPTQVRVSGLGVYYSGVQIGAITANGANHGKLAVAFNSNATAEAVESVVENLTYQNTSSNPFASRTVSVRLTDGDGGASEAKFVTLNVTAAVDGAVPRGLEKAVNTVVAGNQVEPSVAHLATGGYVVVWTDQGGADGNSYGVRGQRYDADDNAVGGEFQVNSSTTGAQYEASVVGLSNGGFVAVWRSDGQDGSSAGVYAQRFDASGGPVGSELRVNESTTGGQYQPDVTALAGGAFAVTWYNDNYDSSGTGSYGDVYVRQFGADGSPLTGQIKANPPTASQSSQYEPAIAVLGDGSFVVTWRTDATQDGDGTGVYAQHFDANGGSPGGEFRVNTYTDSNQYQPDIAALKDGGYLIVWRSEGQDLSSGGIYAQRFDAAGNTVGAEFRVNTATSGNQNDPAVTALENGGWVITWTDSDVFLQQYDAAGRQLDGQTLVNRYTPATQNQPAITSMADGGFVVAYASYVYPGDQNGDGLPDGGNNTQEIRLQRYSNTAPALTDVFVSGLEDSSIVLTDTLFISGFNDPEGQNLAAIKITTLPAEGTLRLDGVALIAGQEISLAELQAGKLSYQGNANYFGLDQFAWTGSDGVAFAGTPVYTNINLANVNDAPALEAGADDTAAEGSFFTHAIVLGDPDPDTHQITVNWGDGSPESIFNTSAALFNIGHTYADDGVYNVTVTANDQQGQANSVEVDGFQVTVSNVAPDLNLFGDATVVQNELYTLTLGGLIEPGADTLSEYRIDWGDGSPAQVVLPADLPANRQLTHAYAASGARTINVSLADEDGSYTNVATKAVTVSAPAEVLTVDAGTNLAVTEGSTFIQTITFTDPTDTDPTGRLYTVDWGDGSTSSGRTHNAGSLDISHRYADDRATAYTVAVTIDDDGAQQASDSFQVTVGNVAPTLSLSGNGSTAEGSLYTLNIAASDPGADSITQYSVDWGDGTPAHLLSAAELAAASGNLSHTYADGSAARTITVQATDEDGTWSDTKAITVADVAPTVTLSGADAIDEGGSYTLTLVGVTDPGQDTPTGYTINWGDGNADVVASLGSYSHIYADGNTTPTISVLVTDEDGAHANAGTQAITVNNVAPTLTLTGNASTPEGSLYALHIARSDPGADTIHTYRIDWGDGSAIEVASAAQFTTLGGNFSHTYADGTAARTITVEATDEDGTWTRTKAVEVNNVAPDIDASGNATATAGVAYTLNLANYLDPGQDALLPNGITIDWGDGENSTVSGVGNFTHIYAAAGTPTIAISLADEDGSYASVASLAITVAPPTPSVAIAAQAAGSVSEGSSFTRSIAFSDGEDSGGDGWTYDVTWNDGVVQTGTTTTQSFQLTRSATDGDATLSAIITVSDTSGTDSDTENLALNVTNVAPSASISGAATVAEGSLYTLTVGAITDPGADTRSAYTIAWGDGLTDSFTATEWTAAAGSFTHTYADGPGSATITVSTTDEDGGFTLGTQAVTVNDVAPTASISGATTIAEGSLYTLTVGPITDPGADTRSAYTIAWGDGSTDSFTAAEWTAAAGSFTHTYADGPGNATITVSTTDEDGSTVLGTQAVTVSNVAPDIDASGAATATVGVAYTLNLANYLDPGQDALLPNGITIDWGDGENSTVSGVGNFTHIYAAAGTPTIAISLADEDGSYASVASLAITVAPPTPSVAIAAQAAGSVSEGSSFTRSIAFSDGEDSGGDGWTYDVTWNDGVVQSGTTATQSFELTRNATDGDATLSAILTVSDTSGTDSDTENLALNVTNVAPSAIISGAATVAEGSLYTLTVGPVADPGADTRSAYTIAWGDGLTDSFTATEWTAAAGSFTHTYADGPGSATITVSTTDEDGGFTLGTQAVTVNNVAPTASISGATTIAEGSLYTLTVGPITDPGADTRSAYTIAWGDGSTDSFTAAEWTAAAGSFTHTYADGPGNATITVSTTDEDGSTVLGTQAVTVSNVAPDIDASGAATATVGVAYTLNLANYLDPGQDSLLPNGITIDWGDGENSTVSGVGNFTHIYAAAGTPTITVSLADEDGNYASVASLAISVAPAGGGNTAPVADDETYTLRPGQTLEIPAPGVLEGDTDADGDALTVLSVDTTGLRGALTQFANGSLRFTPEAGFSGTTRYTYTVSDGMGGRDTATVTLNVTNTAPLADDETYTLRPGQTLEIPAPGVLEGDTDADGDALTVLSVDTTGLRGALTQFANGSLRFTPEAGFSGTTRYTYTVSDGMGGRDTATVTLNVTNTAPLADDETYTLRPGQTLEIPAPGVLEGDTDADGDALTVLSVDTTGLRGALTQFANGSLRVTPEAGFSGTTRYTYTVSDGMGGRDTATVTLNVTNAAPVADDEVLHVWRNGSLSLPAPGLLTGDTDADGDSLVVSGVDTTGLAGNLSWTPDGSLLFTPTAGFAGSTGFSYQVADGNGGVDTGRVRIEVLPDTTSTTIGNAPLRESGLGGQWTTAWTHTDITALHKHDATSAAEAWTPVAYHAIGTSLLVGGDIYGGDLGVSSQSAATSSVRQEIDGSEALRFALATEARGVTVNLSRFFINDDGGLSVESGRLRLLDDSGAVVAETTFRAGNTDGTHVVSLAWQDGFSTVELSAGAWDGTDFVFGAYDGGAPIATDNAGKPHGSDFLVDWVEFDFPILGVPLPPNEV